MPHDQAGTLLFLDPRFGGSGHDTGQHPEHPSRFLAIQRELVRRGIFDRQMTATTSPATDEQILCVHTPGHLANLRAITEAGGGWINQDTLCAADSLEVARHAAGAAVGAVDAVLDGGARRAFSLGRPPGHHATPDTAMGFCLLNSISIAAAHAISRGQERVAIIDWDVHHGNGTQDIFYKRRDVLYCSIHQSPWYPGTGAASEIGAGDGIGFTLNQPLPAGSTYREYVSSLLAVIAPRVRAFRPELLMISAGYDAHRDDPLGQMLLDDQDFDAMAVFARDLANELCEGKLVAVLEGGYDTDALARNVANTIERFDS
jgi:acetoin utilization deacetylase AcuC-like enzyme